MKQLGILTLAAAVACAATAFGQTNTAYTDPSGYVTVPIAKPAAEGQSKLTAFSVNLRQSVASSGKTTSITPATVTDSGASWSNAQWTSEPHLLYLTNAAGAEEAYLITSHTASTLTLSVGYDLTVRYGDGASPGARSYSIVKANTFGGLFGTATVQVKTGGLADADLIYAWNGDNWVTYYHNGTNWRRTGSFANANNDVIFPDEGVFYLRRGTTDLSFVFTGGVPVKPQITTIPGDKLTMVGNRYPVGTTVTQLGFHNLAGWQAGTVSTGDRFYIWNGDNWNTYYYNGTNWKRSGSFSDVDNEAIPANSMIFVLRTSAAGPADSANVHEMPYNLNQ